MHIVLLIFKDFFQSSLVYKRYKIDKIIRSIKYQLNLKKKCINADELKIKENNQFPRLFFIILPIKKSVINLKVKC